MKILISVGGFLGKLYFLTAVTLKFYQKSNSSPKNYLFSAFPRIFFAKKNKNSNFFNFTPSKLLKKAVFV